MNASVSKAEDNVANGGPICDFEESEITPKLDNFIQNKVQRGKRFSVAHREDHVKRSSFISDRMAPHGLTTFSPPVLSLFFITKPHAGPRRVQKRVFLKAKRRRRLPRARLSSLAQVVIKHSNQADVRSIATHVCSSILLNEMVHTVEKYVDRALLNSTEAENLIHPLEASLKQLSQCSGECIDAAAAELSSHHPLGVEKAVIGGEKDEEMDV
ncbi:MAG: hypothetical protein SGARI_008047 [Bacillariaceae sp.]